MRNKLISASLVLVGLLAPLFTSAALLPNPLTGWVNDYTGMLQESEVNTLEAKITQHESATSNEIFIVTLPSLNGKAMSEVRTLMFNNEVHAGQKGKDNGLLIVIAQKEHQIGFETGHGMEVCLTDGNIGSIWRNTMRDSFTKKKYFAGLSAGLDEITKIINDHLAADPGDKTYCGK